ncbi:MAG: NAD(P)H-dependent oxidoreductase [Betaproteobacteria bacterium]|nr:NAD(P)H-dependent oxidoreductase [Betaproteobacteria bacterium]
MNILQVNSSARGSASLSTRLASELVQRLLDSTPAAVRKVRDLGQNPPAVMDETALGALFTPDSQRTPEQKARVAADDALIAEIQAADTVVIAAPMINFGVSAQLKNWIDAISRARVTFRYTERGVEGLLGGRKVYVVLTRGGVHRGLPTDNVVPYLRTVLTFLGMTDVHFVYAEGLSMGPEAEARGLDRAREEMNELIAPALSLPA